MNGLQTDIDKTYINVALFTLKQIIGRTFPNPPSSIYNCRIK